MRVAVFLDTLTVTGSRRLTTPDAGALSSPRAFGRCAGVVLCNGVNDAAVQPTEGRSGRRGRAGAREDARVVPGKLDNGGNC